MKWILVFAIVWPSGEVENGTAGPYRSNFDCFGNMATLHYRASQRGALKIEARCEPARRDGV